VLPQRYDRWRLPGTPRSERGNALAWALLALVLVAAAWWAFKPDPPADVVLYCGVDEDQSRRIAERFEEASGLRVAFFGEPEAFRSIGLPEKLLTEKENPRADVYWSNEIMHTVHLAEAGVLAPLPPGLAEAFPPEWRDSGGMYLQFGARARVFLVNTELLPDPAEWPRSVEDLLDPRWEAKGLACAMARPLSGTTKTHAVALLTRDEPAARTFLEALAKREREGKGLKLVNSNGQVMRLVKETENKVAFGLTDTDDSWIAIEQGAPVAMVYPDQGEGQPGAMLIPNTLALVKGGPHPDAGKRLLEWLASPEVEARLAAGRSAQIPLRPGVERPDGPPDRPSVSWFAEQVRAMPVDWKQVGVNKDTWQDWLGSLFRKPQ
jgi:iron(III) transport system substrate-binding protein